MHIDFILACFGNATFETEPALSSFKRFFPQARTILYTDNRNLPSAAAVDEVVEVVPPYPRSHPRYGWRCSDLYRAEGLLRSTADVAIYSDSDIVFASDKVLALPILARKFGFCLPANPRLLVRNDALIGADSDGELDETDGYGFAYNTAPLAFNPADGRAKEFLTAYARIMRENPGRSPLAMYRAAFRTGYSPYLLPFHWCVCSEHLNLGEEIVLHVGHWDVAEFYLERKPLWLVKMKRYFRQLRRNIKKQRRALKQILTGGARK